jgi:outer membrane protein
MFRFYLAVSLSIGLSVPVHALTLEEAVNKALTNNHEIIEYSYLSKQKEAEQKAAYAPFMPSLDASYSYLRSDQDNKYGLGINETSSADATISYNLFRGGADYLNLKAAKSAFGAQKFLEESVRADVVLNVKKAFYNVLQAKREIDAAQEGVSLLEKQLEDTRITYEVGIAAKNEVLRIEAELASTKQALLQAKSAERTAIFELERLLNERLPADEIYQDFTKPVPAFLSSEELFHALNNNRSELKYIRGLIKAQEYIAKATVRGALPSINVSASYNSYGDDEKPTDREGAYDEEVLLGANLNWNIFDGNARRNKAASQQAYAFSLKHQELKTLAQMRYQLETALENFHLAVNSLAVAEIETLSAEENYRITESQYEERTAPTSDLLDARVMLTRARNNYSKALYDIYKSMADLERITELKLF